MNPTGPWTPADSSKNRLELAETDQRGFYALRNNHDPDRTVIATPDELLSLARSVDTGPLAKMIR